MRAQFWGARAAGVHRSGRWPNGCRSLVNSLLVISTTFRSATWKVFGRRPKNSTRAACAPQSQSARSRVSHVFVVRNCDIICVICAIRSFNPRRTRRAGMPSGRREARKGERSGDRELKRREDFHGRRQARSTPLRAGSATTEFQFKEKAPGRFSPPGADSLTASLFSLKLRLWLRAGRQAVRTPANYSTAAGHVELLISNTRVALDRPGDVDLVHACVCDAREIHEKRRCLAVVAQIIVVIREVIRGTVQAANDIVRKVRRHVPRNTTMQEATYSRHVASEASIGIVDVISRRAGVVAERC